MVHAPFQALAAGGAGERARDRVEHGAEAVAHGGQGATMSDGRSGNANPPARTAAQ